jgi:hypothetical protein
MKTKNLRRYTFLLTCIVISGDAAHLLGANMRSFIESVRRKAAVVYVGSVKEVRVLQRTKFDIKAKAVVEIKTVMRTPATNPQEATIEYSSFDDKTPMLEGGPQYQLRPGTSVIVFANSFDASIPPGYLVQGSRHELLQRVGALREALSRMPVRKAFHLPPFGEIISDATRRNKPSRRKNHSQRKPAEPGDAVFDGRQLSYAHEIVLRSNAFSNPDDRSQRVVVACRRRSREGVRH